jgi:hypothetical protein
MGSSDFRLDLQGSLPTRYNAMCQIGNCDRVVLGRTEVPSLRILCSVAPKPLGEHQIPSKRLQHMLPGSHRLRFANDDRRSRCNPTNDVGKQAIFRPVSPANYIPGACRGNSCPFIVMEKGPAVSRGNQFGSTFAGTVRIVTSQAVFLSIPTCPLPVLIALIACHDHDGANR